MKEANRKVADILLEKEKIAIREAAAMIYAAADCKSIYNKADFLDQLKKMIANTPMTGGYAEANRTLDNLK